MTLQRGMTVRLVNMDGCMATIRKNVREGIVIDFVNRRLYGSSKIYKIAQILMKVDASVVEKVAEPRLWPEYEGMLEYRE